MGLRRLPGLVCKIPKPIRENLRNLRTKKDRIYGIKKIARISLQNPQTNSRKSASSADQKINENLEPKKTGVLPG